MTASTANCSMVYGQLYTADYQLALQATTTTMSGIIIVRTVVVMIIKTKMFKVIQVMKTVKDNEASKNRDSNNANKYTCVVYIYIHNTTIPP